MKKAINSRKAVRTVFNKSVKTLEDLIDEQTDTNEIHAKWNLLQTKHESLMKLDKQIYDLLTNSEAAEDELVAEIETVDEYETSFQLIKVSIDRLSKESSEDKVAAPVEIQNDTLVRKFKLPVLELKKFSGEVKDWLPFWTQFLKIHEDTSIVPEDKFQYLQQATTVGTRARELIDSFPLSRENYAKAVDALKARFGRDELLIEVYVRELLKLVLQNALTQEKPSLSVLYDRLETQLRALETLGVTSEKYEAMLYPLIESALPEEFLRVWQRSNHFRQTTEAVRTKEKGNRLHDLMNFIKGEVEAEQRITLATEGFCLANEKSKKNRRLVDDKTPTAAGLFNCNSSCVFCEKNHGSENCFKAQRMGWEEKRKILVRKRACYRCAKTGHSRRNCNERVKCIVCGKQHVVILCPELNDKKDSDKDNGKLEKKPDFTRKTEQAETAIANLAKPNFTNVFLQTLRVRMYSKSGSRIVRALFDSGSQKSYVLSATANKLNYPVVRAQSMIHTLFGGAQTSEQRHKCYEVQIASLAGDYACKFEVMDQPVICSNISPIQEGDWSSELRNHGIELTDTQGNEPIELLIGVDVSGKLFTGKRKLLNCGLVAEQTLLGWVMSGKTPSVSTEERTSQICESLFSKTLSIKDWWELDILGIKEPKEKSERNEANRLTKEKFEMMINVNQEGRYEVCLPWVDEHPPLPSNKKLAEKRLERTLVKLEQNGYYDQYQEVFEEWCREGIIEEIPRDEIEQGGHYLPHRPVIKENSVSTKIRPVFDASACEKGSPALNDCLEKGENLIELLPDILIKFRTGKYGVIADIRKAFLQIGISENDRNFLRFFWRTREGDNIVYRHKRVVFGVNSSPFLLAANIDHHLKRCLKECRIALDYSEATVQKLMSSFYMDNCVTSVDSEKELFVFIDEATRVMNNAKFELRGWEHSNELGEESTFVLGLTWNKKEDTLSVCYKEIKTEDKKMTKREILSIVQRIFDPLGITCPATLQPKLLLQSLWEQKKGWDEEVDEESKVKIKKWVAELPCLKEIQIPRWFNTSFRENQNVSLHMFCDASSQAYAAVVFLRIETTESTSVHLVAAKTRVTPLKKLSIPRLELLAATIRARLWNEVKKALEIEVTSYLWSDATTVLSWIKRKEEWSIYVWNRVQEIRQLTNVEHWHHVPGEKNPADLLSRGCSPKTLTSSRWWEGPSWLYEKIETWPHAKVIANENEINAERKKSASKSLLITEVETRFYSYFSKYFKNVRMVAWLKRFVHNCRDPENKRKGELAAEEIEEAEKFLIKIAQQESLLPLKKELVNTLRVFHDEDGLLRIESRLINREDIREFLYPYLMPAKHPITRRLIQHVHEQTCHAKGQCLMSILREKFWILGGRHTVRAVTNRCVKCRRHDAKPSLVDAPPLPVDRVREAVPFEVVGIDLAGPLFLKNEKKAWICLFTCATYRAVHLEMVNSLSTHDFLNALRRFIARRGRPKVIFTDNGTNFRGAENLMNKLNWEEIQKDTAVQRIVWKFNPPSAPWWGGWWERLIGFLKQLLKRTLGQACISDDELNTILCDCEAVINARPLTYVSDCTTDLKTLTPAMFLNESSEYGVPDLDKIESVNLNRRYKYLQRLKNELRTRFRAEYLGLLVRNKRVKRESNIRIGEIVFIGSDNTKRINWPLARVIELLPGNDNVVRLVKLQTAHGQLLRPIQRLYALECTPDTGDPGDERAEQKCEDATNDASEVKSVVKGEVRSEQDAIKCQSTYTTKSGRPVKCPARFC